MCLWYLRSLLYKNKKTKQGEFLTHGLLVLNLCPPPGSRFRCGQVEHTRTERRVLATISHPFICQLRYAFQTKQKLYLVLDFHPGGELFYHLSRRGRFREHQARVYAAPTV